MENKLNLLEMKFHVYFMWKHLQKQKNEQAILVIIRYINLQLLILKDNEVFPAPEQIWSVSGVGKFTKRFWQSLKGLSQWDFAKVSWDLDKYENIDAVLDHIAKKREQFIKSIVLKIFLLTSQFLSLINIFYCIPLINTQLVIK